MANSATTFVPGGRRGPQIATFVEVPTRPEKLKTNRAFNKLWKEAMQYAGEQHLKRNIKPHFKANARSKYGYKPRNEGYKRQKMKTGHGRTDLVFSGRSKEHLTNPKNWTTRKGGSATGKRASVLRMTARFPFAGGTGKQRKTNKKKGITPADMVQEMQTTTGAERKEMARNVLQRFMRLVENFKPPRRKRKVKAKIIKR